MVGLIISLLKDLLKVGRELVHENLNHLETISNLSDFPVESPEQIHHTALDT